MAGKMSRNKGQRGEREAMSILQPVVDNAYQSLGMDPPLFKRNLMQTMEGGFDIVGLAWLAIEVKRQETLALSTWWKQTVGQAAPGQTPVLMYRKNRSKWRVMLLTAVIDDLTVPVDMTIESFLQYLEYRIKKEITLNG